jgi:DNA-directed RNA polymerase alpha subunit
MNKIKQILNKHFTEIVLVMLVLLFMRTCNSDVRSLNKRIDKMSNKVDSLEMTVVTHEDLRVEGLRAEKRMIQSTDRKMLDVTRQAEIDKQINALENK